MPQAKYLVITLAMLPHREERSRRRERVRKTEKRAGKRWKWLMRTNEGGKKEGM